MPALTVQTLRIHILWGNKSDTITRRNTSGDANRGTVRAAYLAVARRAAFAASKRRLCVGRGPFDRATRTATYSLGHDWEATIDVGRESVLRHRGNVKP